MSYKRTKREQNLHCHETRRLANDFGASSQPRRGCRAPIRARSGRSGEPRCRGHRRRTRRRARQSGVARGLCRRDGRCRRRHGLRAGAVDPGGAAPADPLGAAGFRRCRDRPPPCPRSGGTGDRPRPAPSGARGQGRGGAARGGGRGALPGPGGGADRALGRAARSRPDGEPAAGAGGGGKRCDDAAPAPGGRRDAERRAHALARRLAAVAVAGGECAGMAVFQSGIAAPSRGAGTACVACGVGP